MVTLKLEVVMRTAILAVVLTVLAACGRQQQQGTDSAFLPFVAQWNQDASSFGVHLDANVVSIRFQNGLRTLNGASGQCSPDGTIQIDTDQWSISPDSQNKVLIYHELGHCMLHQNHTANQ